MKPRHESHNRSARKGNRKYYTQKYEYIPVRLSFRRLGLLCTAVLHDYLCFMRNKVWLTLSGLLRSQTDSAVNQTLLPTWLQYLTRHSYCWHRYSLHPGYICYW